MYLIKRWCNYGGLNEYAFDGWQIKHFDGKFPIIDPRQLNYSEWTFTDDRWQVTHMEL